MPQAQVNNSQLELYTREALQQTGQSEVVQQICNINKEEMLTDPDSKNLERETFPEVVSSRPNQISLKETRQDTSLYAEMQMGIAESGRHR
jgi:hypothetical protein